MLLVCVCVLVDSVYGWFYITHLPLSTLAAMDTFTMSSTVPAQVCVAD